MTLDQTAEALDSSARATAFAVGFKTLRVRVFVKQAALSKEASCTEAAISYWESACRLPKRGSLHKLLQAFGRWGAPQEDLDQLRQAWQRAIMGRAAGFSTRLRGQGEESSAGSSWVGDSAPQ